MKNLIIITGQTATGKTSLALKLAKERGGELVNADSRQIYKYLDIITGKDVRGVSRFTLHVTRNSFDIGYYTLDGIKLWLYDVVDPKEPFSSFDYKVLAREVIDDITSRRKIPIIIGGTYLYIKHLLYGFETENIAPDWDLRKRLNKHTVPELQIKLRKLDVQLFKQLNISDRQNPRRLIRRIEIATFHKIQDTSNKKQKEDKILDSRFEILKFIGLRFKKREGLVKKIEDRVEKRLEARALDEVKSLLKRGYKKNDPGLATIGYKQLIDHIEGRSTQQEAIERWITAEIQYAKRQHTFMKKDRGIEWRECK